MSDQIKAIIEKHSRETEQVLMGLLRFPSTPGSESGAMEFLSEILGPVFTSVEKVELSNSIKDDEDYSSPIPDIDYDGRYNLCVGLRGDKGKRILLNTHIDVVPASAGQEDAFNPSLKDGVIYARGACDAKGQAAVIYLVAKALNELEAESRNELVAHLVVEEENGGNGTLAMARRGEKADAAVVLEPTAGKIFTSARGAVWFRVTLTGKPGHSGKAGQTRSALKLAIEAVEILEGYHKRLLAESKGIDLFDKYENPMPITFGKLHSGTWPATAPGEAVIEGVLGLLPNKTRHEVMAEMEQALVVNGSQWLKKNMQLDLTYRHDSHVLDPEHSLPKALIESCKAAGTTAKIDAMTASCDSWLYNNQLGIPTVVFGAGDLKFAHSNNEQISMNEIKSTAMALVHLLCNY